VDGRFFIKLVIFEFYSKRSTILASGYAIISSSAVRVLSKLFIYSVISLSL